MNKRIAVASSNPVKIHAIEKGFSRMFPEDTWSIESIPVESGVAPQPHSDQETLQGALNRVAAVRKLHPEAQFWAGVEGGIQWMDEGLTAFAWVVLQSSQQTGKARTGAFFLPDPVAELIVQGKELGEADDIVFGRTNSKQANGAVGILTKDVIDRESLYTEAVILALVPFVSPHLYRR